MNKTELRSRRLLLRPFTFADADDVLAYASDPEWARYMLAIPENYTLEDAQEFIAASVVTSWETQPRFAIVLEGQVIGGINLTIDVPSRKAGLGYGLAREHWGNGITTEAAIAVVDWGFKTFDLLKVFATADARNVGSQRVMEKLGMTREAFLRKHRYSRGEIIDEVLYGVLREEWANGPLSGSQT